MKCKPKTVIKIVRVTLDRPTCFNCGCVIDPGTCHCGADVHYAFDPFDGWYVTGSIATERVEITYREPTAKLRSAK